MNQRETDGWEIDINNQFNIKAGAKSSTCPVCSEARSNKGSKKTSLLLDWSRGLGTCQHCGEVTQLHTYKRSRTRDYVVPEWKNNTKLSDELIKYFEGRRISQDTLVKMKITEGIEYMSQVKGRINTIQFNYFEGGKLINIKYRGEKKSFKLVKDAERIFYNVDSIVNTNDCVIVEGEVDVLSFVESGIHNVISVPNGASIRNNNMDYLDSCIDYFNNKTKIILALDSDEAGQNLQQEFIRRLGAENCWLADFAGCKDANDYIMQHGSRSLVDVIANATPCPLENVLTVKDVNEELEDFVNNGSKPGFQIGLDNFDSVFSTYTSQFITVTGIPSSGKSDFVDQMCIGYNEKYNWKIAYASPENKPTHLHTHKIIRKIGDWMPQKEDLTSSKWKEIVEHVENNYYFLEMQNYNLDSVLAKGAELVKRKGIRCLVIDPFNKIVLKGSDRSKVNEYTQEYIAKIDTFCQKYDVLVIVVAHPNKMYKNNGVMDEPTMYSVKGGGEWYDSSYHGLLVHRNYENKTVKVKVLKVKFQNLGENGAETHFKWDHISGLYKELDTTLPWDD